MSRGETCGFHPFCDQKTSLSSYWEASLGGKPRNRTFWTKQGKPVTPSHTPYSRFHRFWTPNCRIAFLKSEVSKLIILVQITDPSDQKMLSLVWTTHTCSRDTNILHSISSEANQTPSRHVEWLVFICFHTCWYFCISAERLPYRKRNHLEKFSPWKVKSVCCQQFILKSFLSFLFDSSRDTATVLSLFYICIGYVSLLDLIITDSSTGSLSISLCVCVRDPETRLIQTTQIKTLLSS